MNKLMEWLWALRWGPVLLTYLCVLLNKIFFLTVHPIISLYFVVDLWMILFAFLKIVLKLNVFLSIWIDNILILNLHMSLRKITPYHFLISWLHMLRIVSLLTYIGRKLSLVYTLILIVSRLFSIKSILFLFLSIVLSKFVRHIWPFTVKYVTSNGFYNKIVFQHNLLIRLLKGFLTSNI